MRAGRPPWNRAGAALFGGAVAAAVVLTVPSASAVPERRTGHVTLNDAFSRAAAEFRVPRDLLVAVGYGETRLDGHSGEPSHQGGYGMMHLVSSPERHALERAARLTGASVPALKRQDAANIRGGAALLADIADRLGLDSPERGRVAAWYPAVARYGGIEDARLARLYADAVYDILRDGVRTRTDAGESVIAAAHDVRPDRAQYARVRPMDSPAHEAGARSEDYPPAHWMAADPANYRAGRSADIDTVIVHVSQGSYAGTINWFRNPDSRVSAHYVIRSEDGDVTQTVRDGDTAWHALASNSRSLGIEHEGYVDEASWFTDAMYRSSATLTAHLCDAYGIPKDREHIVGHAEVPGNHHTDPGPHWDWDRYMELVSSAEPVDPVPSGAFDPTDPIDRLFDPADRSA